MSLNPTIEHAKHLAKNFIDRISWEQCLKVLKRNKFPTSLGAQRTLAKLNEYIESNEVLAQQFISKIKPLYCDLLKAGDRTVMVFSLDANMEVSLLEKLPNIKTPPSIEQELFPLILDDNALSEINSDTKLIHVEQMDKKYFFYYSTKRAITEKKELVLSMFNLSDEVKKELSQFNRITAFTESPRQFIDIVVLDLENSRLEFRLDIAYAVSSKDINQLFDNIKHSFKKTFSLENSYPLYRNSYNFFPMIESIYENKEIRVCELSFVTDGYVHNERDRNSSSSEDGIKGDVRRGEFHQGGIERCDIDVYRVSSRWEKTINEIPFEVEVSLNSTFRVLNEKLDSAKVLDNVIFSMCSTSKAMESILNELTLSDENELSETGS